MKCITYRINGRTAALETDRLYRQVESGRLAVRIANGTLRDASPEEEAAAAEQLGEIAAAGGESDFATMSKTELETWAMDRHGVNLDRRRRKETLIEQARALAAT